MLFHVLGFKTIDSILNTEFPSYVKIFIGSIVVVGVNAFVFISGYFGIKLKLNTAFSIYLQALFYSVILYLFVVLIDLEQFNLRTFCFSFLPISKNLWWFITAYLVLYFLTPFLNSGMESLEYNKMKILMVIILILDCFSSFIFNNPSIAHSAYTVFHLMTIYLLARFLKIHHADILFKKTAPLLFISSTILLFLSVCLLSYYKNAFWALKFFSYNNPLIVLSSVFLFFSFYNVSIKSNRYINLISGSVLGVYLIHDHGIFKRTFLYPLIHKTIDDTSGITLFLIMILVIVSIFIFCSFIDLIRAYIFKKIKISR